MIAGTGRPDGARAGVAARVSRLGAAPPCGVGGGADRLGLQLVHEVGKPADARVDPDLGQVAVLGPELGDLRADDGGVLPFGEIKTGGGGVCMCVYVWGGGGISTEHQNCRSGSSYCNTLMH